MRRSHRHMIQAINTAAPCAPAPRGKLFSSDSLFVAPFASASCEQHFPVSTFTIVSVNIIS
jgi:hypothetical protein